MYAPMSSGDLENLVMLCFLCVIMSDGTDNKIQLNCHTKMFTVNVAKYITVSSLSVRDV